MTLWVGSNGYVTVLGIVRCRKTCWQLLRQRRRIDEAVYLHSYLQASKPKLIHEVFFCLSQFSACAIFDCEDIPTRALNSRAGNCFGDSTVSVKAATVVSAFGPACFNAGG